MEWRWREYKCGKRRDILVTNTVLIELAGKIRGLTKYLLFFSLVTNPIFGLGCMQTALSDPSFT